MKVLLASPRGDESSGGISRWTGHIIRHYNSLSDKKEVELELLDMARPQSFIADDIPLFKRIKLGISDYWQLMKKFNNCLDSKKYDVLHFTSSASWGLLRDLYMINKAHKKRIKTIIHFRFGRIPHLSKIKNWEWKLLSRVIKKTDTAIVIDKSSYECLQVKGFKNIELLPNPLSPHILDFVTESTENKRKPNTLLFVGHCIRPKGIYELIEACSKINNIKLRLIGDIDDKVKQDLLFKDYDWIDILGPKDYSTVLREMLQCDIFVLPTYTEGFPNVILEAMACGCAIITTPVGAIPEMLEEQNGQKYGILVEPKDVIHLQVAIEKMLADEELKNEYRRNVRQRVNERYSMPIVWNNLIEIWRQTFNQS